MYSNQPQQPSHSHPIPPSSHSHFDNRDSQQGPSPMKNEIYHPSQHHSQTDPNLIHNSMIYKSEPHINHWNPGSSTGPPHEQRVAEVGTSNNTYSQTPQQLSQHYTMGPPPNTNSSGSLEEKNQYITTSSPTPIGTLNNSTISNQGPSPQGYHLKVSTLDDSGRYFEREHGAQIIIPSGSPLTKPKSPQERQQQLSHFIGNPSTNPQGPRPPSTSGSSNLSDSSGVSVLPSPNQQIGMALISSTTLPPILPPPPMLPTSSNIINEEQVLQQNPDISPSALSLRNPPPGIKPRITTTLWEDEGTLCFQVDVKGVCVARREDNNMINGTKLLNVSGMSRGRRDGILKAEKYRHVVKVGAMHFKGVWIPYERAVKFACKEKIIDKLYPLFVTDIKTLLYLPNNYARTALIMSAAVRKKEENQQRQREREEQIRKRKLEDDMKKHGQQQQQLQQQPPPPPPQFQSGPGNAHQSPTTQIKAIVPAEGAYVPISGPQYYSAPYGPGTPTVITPVSGTPSDQYRGEVTQPGYIVAAPAGANGVKKMMPSPQQQQAPQPIQTHSVGSMSQPSQHPIHAISHPGIAYSNYYYQGSPTSAIAPPQFGQPMVSGHQSPYASNSGPPPHMVGYSGQHQQPPQQMSPISATTDPSQSRSPTLAPPHRVIPGAAAATTATGGTPVYQMQYFQEAAPSPSTSFMSAIPAQIATSAVTMPAQLGITGTAGMPTTSAPSLTGTSTVLPPVSLVTTVSMGATTAGFMPTTTQSQYPSSTTY